MNTRHLASFYLHTQSTATHVDVRAGQRGEEVLYLENTFAVDL